MVRWTLRLFPLLALLLMGQNYGGGNAHVGASWGSPPVAAGGADCGATVCIAVMDFGEGTDGCADTDDLGEGTRTCTAAGGADADCATGTCPLEGAESGETTSTGDNFSLIGEGPYTGTEVQTLDWRWDADTGGTGTRQLGGLISAVDAYECNAQTTSTTAIQAKSNNGSGSTTIAIVVGTPYWLRLVYDIDADLCTLYVWSVGWGDTPVDVSPEADDGTSATASVAGWQLESGNSNWDNIFDDLAWCDEDLGATSVHCSD